MARVAGVSVATVSRALRGLDRVSPETRERVLRVAEDLHYVASPTATSLASGRTRVVAVVAPFLTRWFFATLVSAIEKSLRAREHHVILFDLEDDSYDQRLPLSQNMLWKRVDGVITLNVPMTPEEVELVDRLGLPLVAIGSPVPGRACVRIDDQAAMRTAVEHLAGLGHTRIGYIGAVPQNVAHIQTPQDRLEAFLEAVAELGLDLRRRLGARLRLDRRGGRPRQRRAAVGGRTARPRSSPPPTRWPSGCARAPGGSGCGVPEDLSIIGIDDYVLSGVLGLTTVRQDVAGLGTAAAELLLRALLDGDQSTDEVVMPTELVLRESTGPVPAPAPASA